MKRLLLFTFMVVLIMSSCGPSEADIQHAIAQTQADIQRSLAQTQAAIPTPTSTPTLEEMYCANLLDAAPLFDQFANAIAHWIGFLNSPVGESYPGTWNTLIVSTIAWGPHVGRNLKNDDDKHIRDGVAEFISLSKSFEEAGVKLQIKISSVEPPQNLKVSHDKVLACIEPAIVRASAIVDFFENMQVVSISSLDACASFDLYLQELRNTCKK
jgi:hypothetical protein